ncbi:MAG: hypothetical protein PHU07_01360 [Acidocella sp.]|nr:hypothetical protein [Acidocella sp.]
MSEAESEDEILDRIESALRKIANLAQLPQVEAEQSFDRAALAASLDGIIARLREGLEPPESGEQTE